MSGFWIKWEKGLGRKPEVLLIASKLNIPPVQAAGCLMLLMEWLDDTVTELSRDGHAVVTLGVRGADMIDAIVGTPGFCEAMIDAEWLEVKDGALTFLNVAKHNGNSAKSRALAQERKRKERSQNRHAKPVTKKAVLCSVSESALNGITEGGVEGVRPEITPEQIYDAYPRKQGKQEALKAIVKAARVVVDNSLVDDVDGLPMAFAYLLSRATAYATATAPWPESEKQYIPHPATWFNRGSYDDDPATWERKAAAPKTDGRQMNWARE